MQHHSSTSSSFESWTDERTWSLDSWSFIGSSCLESTSLDFEIPVIRVFKIQTVTVIFFLVLKSSNKPRAIFVNPWVKMFSFHKPKIYRSISGCCICKAKSSSSRFTDSKKYEPEFERCFRVHEKRSGEICNACVLLVKRWKKLPAGTQRDWRHVVDARAGPGTKLSTPCKGRSSLGKKLSKPKKLMTEDLLG